MSRDESPIDSETPAKTNNFMRTGPVQMTEDSLLEREKLSIN